MVVAGAEVERGKFAVLKLRRQRCIATYQSACAVAVALGLKHLITRNRAALADGPVDGRNESH